MQVFHMVSKVRPYDFWRWKQLFKLFCEHDSFIFIPKSGIANSTSNWRTVAAPFSTPTSSVWGFQFLHVLANTYYCLSLIIAMLVGDTCCFMSFNMKLRYSSAFLPLNMSFVSLASPAFIPLYRLISVWLLTRNGLCQRIHFVGKCLPSITRPTFSV